MRKIESLILFAILLGACWLIVSGWYNAYKRHSLAQIKESKRNGHGGVWRCDRCPKKFDGYNPCTSTISHWIKYWKPVKEDSNDQG